MAWKRKGLYRLPHGLPHKGFRWRVARELTHLLGVNRDEAARIVTAVIKALQDAVQREDRVEIDGLGTFWWRPKAAHRHGLIGKPGVTFVSAPRHVLVFTPHPDLLEG